MAAVGRDTATVVLGARMGSPLGSAGVVMIAFKMRMAVEVAGIAIVSVVSVDGTIRLRGERRIGLSDFLSIQKANSSAWMALFGTPMRRSVRFSERIIGAGPQRYTSH